MLRPLVNATPPDSANGCLARLQLAECLLRAPPRVGTEWEAAVLARAVLASATEAEHMRRAHGALGLALTLLGHYRAARSAYARALAEGPNDPICAHNLGHLEVAVFGRLRAGLRWLQIAHRALPENAEIAASLARALILDGQAERARALLTKSVDGADRARELMESWAEQAVLDRQT
jgi:Flp pilus assembly protein TadD